MFIIYNNNNNNNKVEIIPLVVGCLDGGIGRLLKIVFRVIGD